MILTPMDILHQFPVRKSRKQKQAFTDAVQEYAANLGYPSNAETDAFGLRNLVVGDPASARYLVTAHYDTCARRLLPTLFSPCNFWTFSGYHFLLAAYIAVLPLVIGLLLAFALPNAIIGMTLGCLLVCVNIALLIAGPANPRNANDNTSGVITLLEILRTLPANQRHKVCFVLFDLEEVGLLGSSAYRKAHKLETNGQIVINLDCIGDGDHLMMFPTKCLRKNRQKLTALYKVCGYWGRKSLLIREEGFSIYPSDQANFPYGIGICALRKGKCGLYLSRIHTPKDTLLDETNINILRAALTTYICCDAVQ